MIDIKFAIKRLYNKIYIPVKKRRLGNVEQMLVFHLMIVPLLIKIFI